MALPKSKTSIVSIGKVDWLTVTLAISASLLGIITLYGGSEAGEALAVKNTVWLTLGICLMFAFAYLNYQSIGSYAFLIYGAGVVLLILVLVPFIGTKVKGARSWIRLLGLGFQPAEFMKVALVIALSKYLVLKETEIGKFKELIFPFLITAIPLLLIAAQPDLGSAVIFLPILFMLLFIGGANVSIILGLAIIGFLTLFIPMYLEYNRYVLVDLIYNAVKDPYYKLADAIRILNFEIWQVTDKPDAVHYLKNSSKLVSWAIKTITSNENLAVFHKAVAQVKSANPNFIRDFLSNNLAVFITTITSGIIYGIGLLGFFMYRQKWMKIIANFCLILSLSFLASFAFRKSVNFKPHQVIRVVSFANPDKFSKGAGYQLRHSLVTVGSGQITGKGIFNGDMTRGKTPFLPEWFNDFIFSVVGEQLGFIGSLFLLFLLFGLVIRGVIIALQSKDDYGALLASGITALFFFHIIINIGITLGLLPVTGIPLSFVSYGGSNMVVSYICLGILLNINKRRHINI